MPLNVYKPIGNPRAISILLPTRGRPRSLTRLFDSIENVTQEPDLVDVWLYIDRDDTTTRRLLDEVGKGKYSFGIQSVVGPRTPSQGEMNNALREQCTTNPGVYMYGGDKLLFFTEGWDSVVRNAFERYADRILFAYATDPHHGPSFGAYAFLSAEWTNCVGRMLTEYFPFWFDDEWLDQVAVMIGRKQRLDVSLGFQETVAGSKGSTQRMRNLFFWRKLFVNTIDERIAEADILRRAVYSPDSPEYEASLREGLLAAERFTETWRKRPPEEMLYDEKVFAPGAKLPKRQLPEPYRRAEKNAVAHRRQMLSPMLRSGRLLDALHVVDNISFAHGALKDVQYFRLTWVWRLKWATRQLPRICRGLCRPTRYPEYVLRLVRFVQLCLSGKSGL